MVGQEYTHFQQKSGLREYISVCIRRKIVIGTGFFGVVLSTFYFVYRIPDVYESFSTLVAEEQYVVVNQMAATYGRSFSFYEGILNSRTFIESLIDSVGMEFFIVTNPRFTHEDAVNFVKANLLLKKTIYTSFLRLSAKAGNKELAYRLALIATDSFIKRCRDVASEESRRAVSEIEKQLDIIRKNLEQAEYNLRNFSDIIGRIEEGIPTELNNLNEAYGASLAQSGIKEADLYAEKAQLLKLEQRITPESGNKSPEYLKLRAKLSELEKERIRLENIGIRFSSVSTIDREIQQVEQELLKFKIAKNSIPDISILHQWQELRKSVLKKEGEFELFRKKLESYEKAIIAYKERNPDMLSNSLEFQRLKRSKEVYENLYSILLEKIEEERIRGAANSAGIKVVDLPSMPLLPITKNKTRFYLAGIFIGLLFGFSSAFLLEYNDTTVKSNDDVERFLQLPVLGTIPRIITNKKDGVTIKRKTTRSKKRMTVSPYPRHLFKFDGDDSVITESYRSLRTNILFTCPDNPLRVVALTSAGPSEGKSLTISNLASAFAQMGKKTLLVDTDLRRPVLHHIFNQKREPGFTELFMENVNYDLLIRKNINENLSLITAGMFTPNPAELLGSNKLQQLLSYFKEHYDMVFFDTPPVIAVTDAAVIGTKMDGLLMVIKSNHSDRDILIRAVNILKNVGVKVVGAVLNDINLSHRYSSYGYYKYYYHYYKTKKD